ncbi:ABC transporter ATP-binding protein [Pelagibius sp.]|uniref:ABC transporter ATP-binding protein n=1 Tax=Pelagibius sp. TaxID=1931238 RepID=UPI00260D568E|nr:sn-glycerol-3-phosphate ABC transporter ATP-binding protein UgpC [Pelagibius sp.]
MAFLEIRDLRKSFHEVDVLKGIDIAIDEGGFLVLVGPSGCGKSTLLNTIAGLETITAGEIRINGRPVNDLHPSQRDIAMVFQSYALYPNMNVAENIAFGLEMRGVSKPEREAAVGRVADMLQIDHLLKRRPGQLSGGQRQRVAMGRALVREPQVFLFDEPLSNLDAKLRVDMRTEIKKLHQALGTTIVYVTHDQIEAMTLATQIAVLKDGILQQVGTPDQVYASPANVFVADFMGSPTMNLVPGNVQSANGTTSVRIGAVDLPIAEPTEALRARAGQDVVFGVRPEDVTDVASADRSARYVETVDCNIDVVEPTGADKFVVTRLGEKEFTARVRSSERIAPGDRVPLAFNMDKVHFFDPQTEMRIN